MKRMKTYLYLTLLIVSVCASSCGRVPKLGPGNDTAIATASQDDCGFVQNNYGERVSWKGSLPVKIYYDPGFSAEYVETLRKAAARWENVLGKTLFVFAAADAPPPKGKDGKNVLKWDTAWPEADKVYQANTALNWTKAQLTDADIDVNAKYFTFYVNDGENKTPNDVHLESLLVHELGHFLGLKHVTSGSSVMYPTLNALLKREVPTVEDQTNLKCEYK